MPEGFDADMFEEWVCGCDNCQDACPFNHRHDWNAGEDFPEIADLAPQIQPCNYPRLGDGFLIADVISRTDGHLQPDNVDALRENAARAWEYEQARGES